MSLLAFRARQMTAGRLLQLVLDSVLDYAGVVTADDPIGYWRLGESSGTTATDEMSSHDGTYANSPTLGVTGALTDDDDTAVTFDGSSEYVEADSIASLAHNNADITISLWLKTTTTTNTTIVGFGDLSDDDPVLIFQGNSGSTGELKWVYRSTSTTTDGAVSTGESWNDGNWHHIVGVRSGGSNFTLWMDGSVIATGTNSQGSTTAFDSFTIAALRRTSTGLYFDGSVDDVAVFDYALTDNQVREHYWRGKGYTGYALAILSSGPEVYYRLGESSGTTAADETGTSDGAYANSPTLGAEGALTDDDTAVTFDGSSQYVDAGSQLLSGSGEITLEAWINTTDTDTADPAIIGQYDSGSADRFIFRIDNSAGVLSWWHGDSGYVAQSAGVVNDGAWHHVAAVRDASGNVTLYIDGTADGTGTTTRAFAAANTFIAAADAGPVAPLAGTIDEVTIYQRTLSDAEVLDHYHQGTGFDFDPMSISWHTAFWAEGDNFMAQDYGNGDAVTSWPDETANGRDATQGTASSQPLYRRSVDGLNSKPAVDFDGSDDALVTANFTELTGTVNWFGVAVLDADGSSTSLWGGNNTSHVNQTMVDGEGGWAIVADTSSVHSGGASDTVAHAFFAEFVSGSGGTDTLEVDGIVVVNEDAGVHAPDGIALGVGAGLGGQFMNGRIAFLGLKAGALTSQEKSDLLSWARAHYGTP